MANCKKCGRPKTRMPDGVDWCPATGSLDCRSYAIAFRRGLTRGVEIAKERLDMVDEGNGYDSYRVPDWTDVDRAVREEMGNADA